MKDPVFTRQQGPKETLGSVDGRLQLIDVHSGVVVGIFRTLDARRVTVTFSEKGESFAKQVTDFLNKRVYATGTIQWTRAGLPKSIKVEHLQLYGSGGGKSILNMFGSDPDFTGDISTEEYLRRLRDEQD